MELLEANVGAKGGPHLHAHATKANRRSASLHHSCANSLVLSAAHKFPLLGRPAPQDRNFLLASIYASFRTSARCARTCLRRESYDAQLWFCGGFHVFSAGRWNPGNFTGAAAQSASAAGQAGTL